MLDEDGFPLLPKIPLESTRNDDQAVYLKRLEKKLHQLKNGRPQRDADALSLRKGAAEELRLVANAAVKDKLSLQRHSTTLVKSLADAGGSAEKIFCDAEPLLACESNDGPTPSSIICPEKNYEFIGNIEDRGSSDEEADDEQQCAGADSPEACDEAVCSGCLVQ